MFRKTLLIGTILVLGSVFFVGCTKYIPEENNLLVIPEISESILVMNEIKETTGVDFSNIQPDALIWNFLEDEQINSVGLDGYMYDVRGTDFGSEKINEYFEEKGFALNVYNVADGIYVGQVGFEKDEVVCTVVSGVTSGGLSLESGELLSDITLRCAELNI